MSIDGHGLHHKHTRKRIHQKHEEYPHPDKGKRILDKVVYIAGIFGPLMTIPQLFKIYVEQNATGVSLITWSAYLLCAIVWLVYGIAHREKPIIVTYSLWIVLEILIIVGIVMHG